MNDPCAFTTKNLGLEKQIVCVANKSTGPDVESKFISAPPSVGGLVVSRYGPNGVGGGSDSLPS